MAGNTTPVSGLWGDIYLLRPNGFSGTGLNDLTWGAASSESDSFYIEVVIDAAGTPDTFKWREDGGGWTTGVAITGSSQNIVGTNGTQALTFAATTGHTVNDQWHIGNLYAEATTESTVYAQITDTNYRVLNPNHPPAWTDSGGATLLQVDYTTGWSKWDANVGTVTVAGDNGMIIPSCLEHAGYVQGWTLNINIETLDCSRQQQKYRERIQGEIFAGGTIDKCFLASEKIYDSIQDASYAYLQLFTYDASGDQSGDHWGVWTILSGLTETARRGDLARSNINFDVHGYYKLVTA